MAAYVLTLARFPVPKKEKITKKTYGELVKADNAMNCLKTNTEWRGLLLIPNS